MSFVWYVDQLGLQVQQELLLLVLVLITSWSCYKYFVYRMMTWILFRFDVLDLTPLILFFAILVLLGGIAFLSCFSISSSLKQHNTKVLNDVF
jgi:hypothetical protein